MDFLRYIELQAADCSARPKKIPSQVDFPFIGISSTKLLCTLFNVILWRYLKYNVQELIE